MIPTRVPFGKFLTGVLCIGSGHSMGREGPSVQIGAGLASLIGRWLQLSPERVRDLVPVGAAGALSAAFNTPVAAVLFALEEIIGDMNAALLGSTVVASVAAVIVERSILGNEPLFHVPTYRPNPTTTPSLLDVLARERVQATFFLIDRHIDDRTAPLVARMFADGHAVALHSHTRAYMMMSPETFARTLTAAADHIEQVGGHRPCRAFVRTQVGVRPRCMRA